MHVTLIGLGCGDMETITAAAQRALSRAEGIFGSRRLLEGLPPSGAQRVAAVQPEEIRDHLIHAGWAESCVILSGDTGFYSGAKRLLPVLAAAGFTTTVLPGISSLQVFSARLKRSWQDWRLCSAHGVAVDPVAEVCHGKPAFFLTGGSLTPAELCRQLTEAGRGGLQVTVGEDLSGEGERISHGTAENMAERTFSSLSVLLAEAAPRSPRRTPGLPDEAFLRGKVPMTKQEIRSAILAKLAVTPQDICWDVGAGTGSVSVELALQGRSVWAVERQAEACELIRKNRAKFSAWNLHLQEGTAPEACEALPAPDAVFVGGSGRRLQEILTLVVRRNPKARICVSAIALETLQEAVRCLEGLGYRADVTQISVSRGRSVGQLHLLLAQNPVFLITGEPV